MGISTLLGLGRLYFDLRRGRRFTNPNLEKLKLLKIRYQDPEDCCRDEEEWRKRHPLLGSISPKKRVKIVIELLDRDVARARHLTEETE